MRVRLETGTPRRHARNRRPMAPRGIPLVLEDDFEGSKTSGQKADIERGSGSHLPNGSREPRLGSSPHPWRTSHARFDVSERTISRWMKGDSPNPGPAKRWLTFLRNDREVIAAVGSRSGAVSRRSDLPGAPRFLWEWTH